MNLIRYCGEYRTRTNTGRSSPAGTEESALAADTADDDRGTPVGRRVVLGLLALGAAGVAAGPQISHGLGRLSGALSPHDPTGLSALIPGNGFRYYSVTDGFPYRPPSSYRLQVTGNVARELTLTLDDLRSMPRTRLTRDFQCVTGWRVSNVQWDGVLLSTVLDAAGADADQHALRFFSYDGAYTESLTMSQARRSDVLVADHIDGKPIGRLHGGPARLLVAPMYGYKSCKWLSEIRVVDRVVPGYWEQLGYDVDAWVGHSNARDDAPTS